MYVIVHRGETGESTMGKVVVGLAEPFPTQFAENTVRSASENAEPRECRQERKKTCLLVEFEGSGGGKPQGFRQETGRAEKVEAKE